MIKYVVLLIAFLPLLKNGISQPLRDEARSAYQYLNRVRENPKKFAKEIGANLSNVTPLPSLIWNDTLAKVAETKAMDMAQKNYFAHVTPDGRGINIMIHEAGYKLPAEWIKDKNFNYFESLHAGAATGVEAIKDLILDKNVPGKGHRKHLLGMNEFSEKLTDIGIGHVKAGKGTYTHYTVIIIARQNW